MRVAYSDSHPALYVVHGRVKPFPCRPNSTEPNLRHHEEATYCLNMVLSCFRKRMSAYNKIAVESAKQFQRSRRAPLPFVCIRAFAALSEESIGCVITFSALIVCYE